MTFAVAANEKGEKVLTMPKDYIGRQEALRQIFLEAMGHNFDFSAEYREIYMSAKRAIKNTHAADVVSKELYEQIKWERDVALAQLEEYGVSLGEKADVVKVRHGRWVFGKDLACCWGQILKNKYHLYCSECLEQAFNRSEDNDPDFDIDTPYCPNCGAKMDKEEEQ